MGKDSGVKHELNRLNQELNHNVCVNYTHGGDVYRHQVALDFSVNLNPMGIPQEVKAALQEAVEHCGEYPDYQAQNLRACLAENMGLESNQLLIGNGASELFMAIVHGIRPKRVVIPVPSFYGYEYGISALGEGTLVQYYEMQEENNFQLDEGILSCLDESLDLLFLANPNNPVGNLLEPDLLETVLRHCRGKQIYVVLDECFIELCPKAKQNSYLNRISEYPNLLVVRAFTKTFGIPGVRLGYLACGDLELSDKIGRQLPEWNVSMFAQRAGMVISGEKKESCAKFLEESVERIEIWRTELAQALQGLGLLVYPGDANFILFQYTEDTVELAEELLERGILIRDCSNYRGLSEGYFRVAVKRPEENAGLIQALTEIMRSV